MIRTHVNGVCRWSVVRASADWWEVGVPVQEPIGTVSTIDVRQPDDQLLARPTGDTRRTAPESDRVREVSAERDHRVLDVCAPSVNLLATHWNASVTALQAMKCDGLRSVSPWAPGRAVDSVIAASRRRRM
jgi:hypothetical protein